MPRKIVPENLKLFPYQADAVRRIVRERRKRWILGDEMGCIGGDSVLQINRARKGVRLTIRELAAKEWDFKKHITTIKAYCGEELRHHRINAVLSQGLKQTLIVNLSNGKFIRCTPDHKILTKERGWIRADKLYLLSDMVATNGRRKCANCGSSERKVSTYKYAKYLGWCTRCTQRQANLNRTGRTGAHIDKDGYVLVTGQFDHPQATAAGHVYQHRLVVEARICRHLLPGEVVHHIDGNKQNNGIENLELLDNQTEHAKRHPEYKWNLSKDRWGNEIFWSPVWSTIAAITYDTYKYDVYDLVMEDPHRNFVANGIIVHNCGKTPEAICTVNAWNCPRTLYIVPPNLKLNWEREILRWDTIGSKPLVVRTGKDKVPDSTNAVILSDALFGGKKWLTFIKEGNFDAVVVDEAHRYKNWKSQRTRSLFKVLDSIDKALLLTGTPMTRSIIDLHPLCCAMEPGKWGKLRDFGHEFSNPVHDGFSITYVGHKNIKRLRRSMSRFMIRRFKKDVLPELPPKLYSVVPVELDDPAIAQESLQYVEQALKIIGRDSAVSHVVSAPAYTESTDREHVAVIRRLLGIGKIAAAVEFLLQFDEPIVVFAHHRGVIDGIVMGLADAGRSVCSITGATSSKLKDEHVQDFQAKKYQYIVCNTLAAGVGISLTAASKCVIAELDWTSTVLLQAIDRLHRIGQLFSVNVYFIIAANSLDDRIIDILLAKMETISAAVGGATIESLETTKTD